MIKHSDRANITLPEIFEYVNKQTSNDDKYLVLRRYSNTMQMKWFVNAMYNFDFKDYYIPKYRQSTLPVGLTQTIGKNIKRIESAIRLFQRGNTKKYDDLMTITLESVSKDEAVLLEQLFANKKVEGISKSIWKKLYPDFFRNEDQVQEV